jgi:hypothetical protein
VPVLAGHFWLQPVPNEHALVSLDISDAERLREVSRVTFGDDEGPHWASLDASGRRVVVNSAGSKPNRLYIVDVDAATGKLEIDGRFKDATATGPGVSLTGKAWPHGFNGEAEATRDRVFEAIGPLCRAPAGGWRSARRQRAHAAGVFCSFCIEASMRCPRSEAARSTDASASSA